MLEKAKIFAKKVHKKQQYGAYPYYFHLESVANIVKQYGEIAETLAYLHDTVEDTNATIEQIKNIFGSFIAECVFYLTDETGINRSERKEKTYYKIRNADSRFNIVFIVKAADRLANMQMCLLEKNTRIIHIYVEEYQMFKNNIYREGLCDDIWSELNYLYFELLKFKI